MNKASPLAIDARVLILDLNGVMTSHFWLGEDIPQYTKRMTEVSYKHGHQWVFFRPRALSFLLWCFEHFMVYVWSWVWESFVFDMVSKAFPKNWNKFASQILLQVGCTKQEGHAKILGTDKPLLYKELLDFWHHKNTYNVNNTLIIDDFAYKCF